MSTAPPPPDDAVDSSRVETLTSLRVDAVVVPSLRIVVETPGQPNVELPLDVDTLLIGSSSDCDIVVTDGGVSRQHCEIRIDGRGIAIRDLDSKNGTYIGEIKITEAEIPISTRIRVGNSCLTLLPNGTPKVIHLSPDAKFGEAIGASVGMRALFSRLRLAASTREPILLLGESGTGKEILARAVHDVSPRAARPYVVFDCSGTAPSLVEAELFGYVKGAFTGAIRDHTGVFVEADGGTIFLDEIGELPLDLQPKLLRALESQQVKPVGSNDWRSFDVRVIAATHRNLKKRIGTGEFREDLYYRLAVMQATIPPLRERKDDIPILVESFLSSIQPALTIEHIHPSMIDILMAHRWPGNVRELRNTVARLAVFPQLVDEVIDPMTAQPTTDSSYDPLLKLPLREARDQAIEQFERRYLTNQLRTHGGNVSRTAESVGVSRQFLHRLIERHGIRSSEFRTA